MTFAGLISGVSRKRWGQNSFAAAIAFVNIFGSGLKFGEFALSYEA